MIYLNGIVKYRANLLSVILTINTWQKHSYKLIFVDKFKIPNSHRKYLIYLNGVRTPNGFTLKRLKTFRWTKRQRGRIFFKGLLFWYSHRYETRERERELYAAVSLVATRSIWLHYYVLDSAGRNNIMPIGIIYDITKIHLLSRYAWSPTKCYRVAEIYLSRAVYFLLYGKRTWKHGMSTNRAIIYYKHRPKIAAC